MSNLKVYILTCTIVLFLALLIVASAFWLTRKGPGYIYYFEKGEPKSIHVQAYDPIHSSSHRVVLDDGTVLWLQNVIEYYAD